MKKLSLRTKIFLILSIVVLVVGMVFLGVFGFNNTVDYSDSRSIEVSVEKNLGNAGDVMSEVCETYFKENGIRYASYATQKTEGGETIIYKFKADSDVFSSAAKAEKVSSDLKTLIDAKFSAEGGELKDITATVTPYATHHISDKTVYWALLSAGIAFIAIGIFVTIFYKFSSALTVILNGILSALLTLCLVSITRIPAQPFVWAAISIAAVLGSALTSGITARAHEQSKNVANSKDSLGELINKAVYGSNLRFILISVAILACSVLFVALGPDYLRLMGVQILLAGIASLSTAYSLTEILWPYFKNLKKNRKTPVKDSEESK